MKQTMVWRRLYWVPIFLAICLAFAFVQTHHTKAAINPYINFQGKLTNPDGTNLTNGSYTIVFSIYTVASGGSNVWTESKSVTVADGIFQTSLGDTTALPGSVNFNTGTLYLGIKVGTDAEMTPRVMLTAAPYAFNSESLGGLGKTGYVQLAQGMQTDASTTNPSIGINKTGATADIVQIQKAGVDVFKIANNGNLTVTGSVTNNLAAGNQAVFVATAAPTVDMVKINNTGQPVTTAGVNGLQINYVGGAAAVEAAGFRMDYTPGSTSGGTWSGVRIVETSAAASGVNSYGIKLEGAGTGAGNSYGIQVATGWDIGIDVQSGGLQLAAQSDPATPAAGNLRIYAKDIAGRVMPKWVGPSGVDTPVQASFGFNRIAMMAPAGSGTNCSTSLSIFGSTATGAGTCSYTTLASTNLKASVRRMSYSSGTTAGTVAYQRQAALMAWRGSVAGQGGFFFTTRFGMSTLQAGNRAFVGLSDSIANPTNVDPTTSTTPGKIGMAINANTGNWSLVSNVTGTAPTVTGLGANFPVDTTSLYELVLFSAPNGSTIGWRVTNLSTGNQTSGSIGANMPATTTFLSPVFWVTNNATAAAAIIDTAGWYLESDN